MNLLEILKKPAQPANYKSFKPAATRPVLPKISPTSIFSKLAEPLPLRVTRNVKPLPEIKPKKELLTKIPTTLPRVLKPIVGPLPPRVVELTQIKPVLPTQSKPPASFKTALEQEVRQSVHPVVVDWVWQEHIKDIQARKETIGSAPEQDSGRKIIGKLPKTAQDVIKNLEAGFFGEGDPFGTGKEDKGLAGLLFPYFRTDAERIIPRYDKLVEAGVDENLASEISLTFVSTNDPIQKAQFMEKRKGLISGLSEEEQKPLKKAAIWDIADKAFFGLDVFFMGGTIIGRTAIQKIAKSRDPLEIANLLKKEVPNLTDENAGSLSRIFVRINNTEDVEMFINRLNSLKQTPEAVSTVKTIEKAPPVKTEQGVYFRGVKRPEDALEISKDRAASYGKGIYLTDDASVAKDFGKNVVKIQPTRALNLYTPTESERLELISLFGAEQDAYIKKLLGNEYDGFKIVKPKEYGPGAGFPEVVVYDKNLLKTEADMSEKLTPLYEEARKYKTAEEFVNKVKTEQISKETVDWLDTMTKPRGYEGINLSRPSAQIEYELNKYKPEGKVKLYRGTNEAQDVSRPNTGVESWTYDKNIAKDFGMVIEREFAPNEIFLDTTKLPKDLAKKFEGESEVLIKRPDFKSQLTDIWERANDGTSKAKKGEKFTPDITKDEVEKLVRNFFSPDELDLLFDPEMTKRDLLGELRFKRDFSKDGLFGRFKPIIELMESGGKVSESVAYHEIFHAAFHTRFTGAERQIVLDKVKKSYLTIARKLEEGRPDVQAEEWLADDFADYVRAGKSKGGFDGLWERFLSWIRDFIRRANGFNKLYDDILAGRKTPEEIDVVVRAKKVPEERLGDWKEEASQELTAAEKNLVLKTKAIQSLKNRGLSSDKEAIELLKLEREFAEMAIAELPGKELVKYVSKTTGELPEVTGKKGMRSLKGDNKIVKNSIWGVRGDDIAKNMLGFESVDDAKTALDKYLAQRDRLESIKKELAERIEDFSSKRAILRELRKEIAKETESRINKVRAIQAFFKLTDQEISKIMGFKGMRNISLMTDKDFYNFLRKMEGQASANFVLNQERLRVEGTIFEKELIKVDNLRKALKLPEIKNMSVSQLREFGALLETFEHGDEFLGVRQLETVKNTNLKGINTVREAQEKFMEESGASPADIARIIERGATGFDNMRAASLPEVSPFHRLVYEDMIRVFLDRDKKVFDLENQLFPLMRAARKSRPRGVTGRLVPADQKIWEWLNATNAEKFARVSEMTTEELSVAHLTQEWLAEARDYLIKNNVLKGTRFYNNYISHVQRDFLEAVKEDGLMAAWREMKSARQLVEANFEILSGKEGDILPLEKFFRYSLRRPDNLKPSKNIAKVFMQYARAFYTKQALDSIVPKLVIYAHTMTPKRMTQRGLEYNDSLKRWLNKYINSQKGRPPEVLAGLINPGGKVDWALRTGVALMRILDLGLNLSIQIAAPIGEQVTILPALRERQALGLARLATKKGRATIEKYKNFTGKTLVETLREPTTHVGQKGLSAIFAGFQVGARKASETWLLASMTKDEWARGEITSKRLAEMKAAMSRYRAIEKSILGTTSLGQGTTQYRSWAIPIISRNVGNLSRLTRMVGSGEWKKAKSSKEFRDLFASTITTAAVALGVYTFYSTMRDKKDRTLLEDIAFKSARESLTIIGAMDPTLYTSSPRILSFFYDLSSSLKLILQGDRYKTGENKGELKGLVKLKKTLVPKALKQLENILPEKSVLKQKPITGIKLKKRDTLGELKLQSKESLSGIKLVPREKIKLQ